MELYQVSSRELDGWIAEHLQPSKKFRQNVQDDIHRICKFLKETCSMDAKVIQTVKSGSAGKGTALDGNSDADLVIFLDSFSSYKDLKENRASIIKTIETELNRCHKSIAYKVDIQPPKVDDSSRRSLSLIIRSTKKKEPVEVDILPTYYVLGQITQTYKPPPEVYINLIKAVGRPGEFNTSFTELQRNFVKCCPVKVKNLLRLVKHWYKEYKEEKENSDLKPPLPCGYIHSWKRFQESTSRQNQEPESRRQFVTVYNHLLATPATSLEPIVSALAFPLDYFSDVEGFAAWCLKKTDPSSSLPPKFALELLTIYAWEEGAEKAEKFNTAEGFCTVMELLCRYQDLCFYWTRYYGLEHPEIGAYVKRQLKGQRPVILDPADPTGNVGKGKGWNLLAKEAQNCLGQPCCKKGIEPVQSWKVQPARAIQVEVKQLTRSICSVSCSPYVTIQQIKVEIEKRNYVSAHEQLLALPDSSMDDYRIILEDDKTLAHYGVFYHCTILQLPTKPQEMDILVKDMNGRTSVYTISTNATALELKRKIEGRTQIPLNQQRLTYNEKELEDGKKLSYYNIRSKGTVYLLLRLRGGQI